VDLIAAWNLDDFAAEFVREVEAIWRSGRHSKSF
jgi:hypothetical protein